MKTIIRSVATGLVIVAGALATVSARAEGWYVGGNVGSSRLNGDDVGGLPSDRSDTGYKLFGGYSFNPNFGLETGYADLGEFGGAGGTLRARGLFVDAVGTYPLGNGFSLLGRVGMFHGRLHEETTAASLPGASDRSGSGTNVKLGAGLQYDIGKSIALRGEWEHYRFDALDTKPGTNLLSVGMNYRF